MSQYTLKTILVWVGIIGLECVWIKWITSLTAASIHLIVGGIVLGALSGIVTWWSIEPRWSVLFFTVLRYGVMGAAVGAAIATCIIVIAASVTFDATSIAEGLTFSEYVSTYGDPIIELEGSSQVSYQEISSKDMRETFTVAYGPDGLMQSRRRGEWLERDGFVLVPSDEATEWNDRDDLPSWWNPPMTNIISRRWQRLSRLRRFP